MKKLFWVIVLISFVTIAKTQTAINETANTLSKNTMKKLKNLPDNAKLTLTFFLQDIGFADTIKTHLGIRLTKHFAHSLRKKINKSKNKVIILFPEELDATLNESMQPIFTVPDDKNEAEYWKEFNNNQTADYFFVAKYSLSADGKTLKIINPQIVPNPLGKYAKENAISIDNVTSNITEEQEIDELTKINIAVNNLPASYNQLIEWNGEKNNFTIKILNELGKEIDNLEIFINKEYQISLSLTEDAYLYCFYYDAMDPNFPYISMLYPYQNKQDTFFKKGKITIPPGATFVPDAPCGQIFIKIFAVNQKIDITFEQETDADGYVITKFNDKNCKDFLTKLNKLDKTEIGTKQLVLTRK